MPVIFCAFTAKKAASLIMSSESAETENEGWHCDPEHLY
jgi:hypothetical protein